MLWSLSASKWGQLSSNHLMSMSTSTPTMHALCFWEQSSYVNVNIHSHSACSMFLRTIILCQCQHPLLQCMLCFLEQSSYVIVNIHSYSACSTRLRTTISCQCQHPLLQHILRLCLWKQPSYVNVNIHSYSACPMFLRTTTSCQCQHPLIQCMPYVFENHHLMSMSTSTHTLYVPENKLAAQSILECLK